MGYEELSNQSQGTDRTVAGVPDGMQQRAQACLLMLHILQEPHLGKSVKVRDVTFQSKHGATERVSPPCHWGCAP